MQRSFLALCITILLLSGCITARNRLSGGVSSAETTTETANNGFADGIVEWVAGLPFGLLDVIIDSEIDEDRFSDPQLKSMGIERGSKEHERLIAEQKQREDLERLYDD